MKAIHDKQNYLILTIPGENGDPVRIPNSPRFTDICGGVGWPDLAKQESYAQTWFVAVGQAEDGTYQVIAEVCGAQGEVAKAMIDWKDILYLKTIYYEEADDQKESIRFFRDPLYCDGLTFYDWTEINEFTNQPVYLHTGSYWKHFRSYDDFASLVPARDHLIANPLAGWERIIELNRRDKLVVLAECPKVEWILGRNPPWKEILEHPLAKALIWCLGMMDLDRPRDEPEIGVTTSWYGNLR